MNKKKSTVVAGLAVTLLVGASSLAYFTDRVESTFTGKAGTVTLDETDKINVSDNMAPGDVEAISVNSKYTGSLEGKVRVRIEAPDVEPEEGVEYMALGDKDSTEGFVILNEKDEVVEAGDIIELDGKFATGQEIKLPLKVKLLEQSQNNYQDKSISVNYIVEALQDRNTKDGWTGMDGGEIEILKAQQ